MTASAVMAVLAELSYSAVVSSYHLHARMFRGLLAAPDTNTLQTAEGDDRDTLLAQAEEMSRRGFAVWVYEHPNGTGLHRHDDYRVIAEWRATGNRVR